MERCFKSSFHPVALGAGVATLVFDIETSALPLETLDSYQQEYIFREANKCPDEVSRQTKGQEIFQQFNLWPATAQVVCIAMLNADSARGQVLFTSDDCEATTPENAAVEFVPCVDEAELLSLFWETSRRYEGIVTFNGRGFDVPFLYLRSAILNIPISRKDWLGYRYSFEPHCDLLEQLTFYGVSGREGAARRFNLDFYCKLFDIPSPKRHGISGLDVNGLVAEGRFREVAEYCLADVEATVLLYHLWKERLAGIK